ncbi:MAG: CNT family concentrative nucleoside transporter, partial [Sediminicola sp.]
MKYRFLITLSICLTIFSSFAQETTLTDTIQQVITPIAADNTAPLLAASTDIVPNQGFTTQGLLRGILGMAVLILIAVLFSSNRRAINWKTVAIGLALQLTIAVGVLQVPIIQLAFEKIGQVFVSILEYTNAGSKFLFEGLVVDMDTFGFIFAFQVLPTIIF